MSYILDALRKADAERERDPARGIHAQPLAPADAQARFPWTKGALAVAVGLLVAAAAVYFSAPRQPAPPRLAPVAAVGMPPVVTAPVNVIPVAATSVLPAAPPMPAPAPVAAVIKAPAPPAPVAAAAPKAAVEAPVAKAAAPAEPARILAQADLPPDVLRELPKLAISGGVHSDNAAQRMLIVGGQVMTEGMELAPGLVLEQIRARTAVLKFKGYRYSVGY